MILIKNVNISGRTSRTGNPGTSQFVLMSQNLDTLEDLQKKRDDKNLESVGNATKDISKIALKAEVFDKFCKILNLIREQPDDQKLANEPTVCSSRLIRESVEERFGNWLKINRKLVDDEEKYLGKFGEFEAEIFEDAKKGELVKNPYYLIKSGNSFLKRKDYQKAIDQYSSAITLDENFAENAFYNRGCARVALFGGNIAANFERINLAISDLRTAQRLIENRIKGIKIIQNADKTSVNMTELSLQLKRQVKLLNVQKKSINSAVGTDWMSFDINASIEDEKKRINKIGILNEAILKKTNVEISLVDLESELDDVKSYKDEIDEFTENGFLGSFMISLLNLSNLQVVTNRNKLLNFFKF